MNGRKSPFSKIAAVFLLSLVFLLSISLKPVDANAGQITLKPTDDTYVTFESRNSNYGGSTYLWTAIGYVSRPPKYWEDIIWLKFDLSNIPNYALIDNATLRLYSLSSEGATFAINAHSCSNTSWSELTLAYSSMPSYYSTSMGTVQVTTLNQWYNWSVVDAVRNAVSNSFGAVTIVLDGYSLLPLAGFNGNLFASKESIVNLTDYSPELSVYWSDPVTEFPTFVILPFFMAVTLIAAVIYKRKAVVPKFV